MCGSSLDSSALRPDVFEDKCGDEKSEKDSNDTIADVIEIGIGRIDFVGPASMAEIVRHRLSELREFTRRKSNPDRTALNSLELEFVNS